MHTRHGLRTVTLGAPGADRRTATADALSGTATRRLRLLPDPPATLSEPLEAVGDRELLLDDTGRSVAVVQVDAIAVADWASIQTDGGPRGPWSGRPATRPDDRVAVISFHVVGRSES